MRNRFIQRVIVIVAVPAFPSYDENELSVVFIPIQFESGEMVNTVGDVSLIAV